MTYYPLASGFCAAPVEDHLACKAAATSLERKWKKNPVSNLKMPGGCFLHVKSDRVMFNEGPTEGKRGTRCKPAGNCICEKPYGFQNKDQHCTQPVGSGWECKAAANSLNLKFKKSITNTNLPGGCIFSVRSGKVVFNKGRGNGIGCQQFYQCVCEI